MPTRRAWYTYISGSNPNLPGSYILLNGKPVCINGDSVCCIYAVYTSLGPSAITTKLQTYIGVLLSTGLAQPNGAGQMPYVYGIN